MLDKDTIIKIGVIISISILLIILIIAGYIYINNKDKTNISKEDNLYVVTKSETGFGISKINGKSILNSIYTNILRINNTVYLSNDTNSYFYFLDTGKSINLEKKETQVYVAKDYDDNLLNYFILRYGESEDSSIYRIYSEDGNILVNKDFPNIQMTYDYIKAYYKENSEKTPEILSSKYSNIIKVNFLSNENKKLYIVSKKENNDKQILYGVVDEDDKLIIDIKYTKIENIQDSKNGIKCVDDKNTFIYLKNEKMYPIESGFDIGTSANYYYQKKGNNINKLYNLKGELVISGIYKKNEDIFQLNAENNITYVLVKNSKDYLLYDINNNIKIDKVFYDVKTEYFKEDKNYLNTAFIYSDNTKNYIYNLKDKNSYKLNNILNINSPLDCGVIYKQE